MHLHYSSNEFLLIYILAKGPLICSLGLSRSIKWGGKTSCVYQQWSTFAFGRKILIQFKWSKMLTMYGDWKVVQEEIWSGETLFCSLNMLPLSMLCFWLSCNSLPPLSFLFQRSTIYQFIGLGRNSRVPLASVVQISFDYDGKFNITMHLYLYSYIKAQSVKVGLWELSNFVMVFP